MIIANDPRFHETWEKLQREMGNLLTASYSETKNKKDFLKAVDKVENRLVNLYLIGVN